MATNKAGARRANRLYVSSCWIVWTRKRVARAGWDDMYPNSEKLPGKKDLYCYFRLGLVTGLLDKQVPVEWADRQIMRVDVPEYELVELSLSGSSSYSQVVYLLRGMQGLPDYHLALPMLLAKAGQRLEADPGCAVDLVLGLRLLLAEDALPVEARLPLLGLRDSLEEHRAGGLKYAALYQQLVDFLQPYLVFRRLAEAVESGEEI